MRTLAVIGTLCLLLLVPLGAQTSRELSRRQQQLQKLRTEIDAFEKKLKQSERQERVTLERLDDLEKQGTLIRELIRKLKEEEQQLTEDIRSARNTINGLEEQLAFLKSHYAGYVRSVYKNGRVYDLELLFSSRSINQLSIRIEYLKRFSNQRVEDLRRIMDKKTELEARNADLEQSLEKERKLLADKTREEQTLKQKTTQRQQALARIRKDTRTYRQELRRKTSAVQEIEKIIAELIEKERIRKEREEAERRERERRANLPPAPPRTETASPFEHLKGKLRWPVRSGSIASRFGNQIHPVLKTVTQNTGIDIAVPIGSDVIAVADAEVSILKFIPGYGNVLILNHYGGYRTVYAHLSDIFVTEGERVREGEAVGRSGDSIAGSLLHFEVWKEREKQNPEHWLTKWR